MQHVPPRHHRTLAGARVAIVAHGVPSSPPAGGVREYLAHQGAHIKCLFHPLGPEQDGQHVYEDWRDGLCRTRVVRLPSRPPLTYPFDVVMPFARGFMDLWIGFDSLSTARGLARRRQARVGAVIHWSVDFVPNRFGEGTPLTRAYEVLDAFCCRRADLRVEVSESARRSRTGQYALGEESAPAFVVPIGIWADKAPRVPEDAFAGCRVVFVGHLVERMGVDTAIRAIALLRRRGLNVALDVVGRGPEQQALQDLSAALKVDDLVVFHGFRVGSELEERLTSASIAIAPYRDDGRSFTQFADPSKLKTYMATGLPIVMTRVPPNAGELAVAGVADLVDDRPEALADAIARLLGDSRLWAQRRAAALRHARQYDWPALLAPVLDRVGLSPTVAPGDHQPLSRAALVDDEPPTASQREIH